MTKVYEMSLQSQVSYYKGKCEVYERLLISAGLLDDKGKLYEQTDKKSN